MDIDIATKTSVFYEACDQTWLFERQMSIFESISTNQGQKDTFNFALGDRKAKNDIKRNKNNSTPFMSYPPKLKKTMSLSKTKVVLDPTHLKWVLILRNSVPHTDKLSRH